MDIFYWNNDSGLILNIVANTLVLFGVITLGTIVYTVVNRINQMWRNIR